MTGSLIRPFAYIVRVTTDGRELIHTISDAIARRAASPLIADILHLRDKPKDRTGGDPDMLLFMALLQSAADLPPIDFDLAKLETACASGGGAIVVCGRRRVRPPDRVTRHPEVDVEALPKADIGLFGQVRGKVSGQNADVGGFKSNRAMVTVAVPF